LPLEKEVVYFVTLCVKNRQPALANDRALAALRSAVARLEHWWVYAAILMPDHAHVLAAPDDRDAAVGNLSGALKRWIRQAMAGMSDCRASAPLATGTLATGGSAVWQWQPGSFDRLLRTEESAQAKWEYMRENPVRSGLVRQWTDWPYSIGFRQPDL
jgi:REP element-mobilizing transposase RayT